MVGFLWQSCSWICFCGKDVGFFEVFHPPDTYLMNHLHIHGCESKTYSLRSTSWMFITVPLTLYYINPHSYTTYAKYGGGICKCNMGFILEQGHNKRWSPTKTSATIFVANDYMIHIKENQQYSIVTNIINDVRWNDVADIYVYMCVMIYKIAPLVVDD